MLQNIFYAQQHSMIALYFLVLLCGGTHVILAHFFHLTIKNPIDVFPGLGSLNLLCLPPGHAATVRDLVPVAHPEEWPAWWPDWSAQPPRVGRIQGAPRCASE